MNVEKVLRAFPDYGKSPPSYVTSLVQLFVSYPAGVQDRLTDLKGGIPSKCQYLPTVADVVKLADEFLKQDASVNDFKKRFTGKFIPRETILAPFRPFEQLWAAFEHSEPELLVGRTFGALDDACKALITQSKQRAREILKTNMEKL